MCSARTFGSTSHRLEFRLTLVVWPLPGDSWWAAVLSSVKWDGKPIQSCEIQVQRGTWVLSSEVFLSGFLNDLQAPYTLRLAHCPLQGFLSPQLWAQSLRARPCNVYRRVRYQSTDDLVTSNPSKKFIRYLPWLRRAELAVGATKTRIVSSDCSHSAMFCEALSHWSLSPAPFPSSGASLDPTPPSQWLFCRTLFHPFLYTGSGTCQMLFILISWFQSTTQCRHIVCSCVCNIQNKFDSCL